MELMGIVNVTPDSFYAPSRVDGTEAAMARIAELRGRGCSIIDIGAVSTRPGAAEVSVDEEWRRLEPVLTEIAGMPADGVSLRSTPPSKAGPLPLMVPRVAQPLPGIPAISIDTTSSEIVRKAYDILGPFIVNDISAGEDDPQMLATVAELGLSYIAMHKRGNPRTMDSLCEYPRGVVEALDGYFTEFAARAESIGIKDWILDPGFGFSKNPVQNWELLENLQAFRHFGRPILVGVADKRFTRTPNPFDPGAAPSSEYAERLAKERGADILRIH